MNQEQLRCDELFKKVNFYLSISGSHIDNRDVKRNRVQRLLNRLYYCFNLILILSHLFGELIWAINGFMSRSASLTELTYTIPGVTLCLIGMVKSYYLITNFNLINDLITTIKLLQVESAKGEQRADLQNEIQRRIVILSTILNANNIIYFVGLGVFAVGPLILSWVKYNTTGELVMQLPFFSYFPFDETDIRYWPYAYIHQMWAAVTAVSTVHGPDSFYSFSCTFLLIQFKTLQYDIERICPYDADFTKKSTRKEFKKALRGIMVRHNELIRAVDIVENIFSKSTLGNLAVSAMVMCVSAFNVVIAEDAVFIIPFSAFFIMWTLEVFVLCYFSDLLIESSTEVSNAVYHSNWYNANAAIMRDLLFVLTRAQKPCKLTAMGYTDLNLRVFSRICSSAWSYFAILQTFYSK